MTQKQGVHSVGQKQVNLRANVPQVEDDRGKVTRLHSDPRLCWTKTSTFGPKYRRVCVGFWQEYAISIFLSKHIKWNIAQSKWKKLTWDICKWSPCNAPNNERRTRMIHHGLRRYRPTHPDSSIGSIGEIKREPKVCMVGYRIIQENWPRTVGKTGESTVCHFFPGRIKYWSTLELKGEIVWILSLDLSKFVSQLRTRFHNTRLLFQWFVVSI